MLSLKKFIAIIFCCSMFLFGSFAESTELYKNSDDKIMETLSLIETQIYGKNYDQQSFEVRLGRLEQSFFNEESIGNKNKRLEKITASFNKSDDYLIKSKQMVFLKFIEQRYFSKVYETETIDIRLSRLEIHFFGKNINGSIDDRYKNLLKNLQDCSPNLI